MSQDSKLRDITEIQRVHDIMEAIARGEVPNVWGEEGSPAEIAATASLRALCWVLSHDIGEVFIENIRKAEAVLEKQGFILYQPDPKVGWTKL